MTDVKISWMQSQDLSNKLFENAQPVSTANLEAMTRSGIYALIYCGTELGGVWAEPTNQMIYVGRGDKDSLRHFGNHTATSTVRRSLAAMLAHSLHLNPVPGSDDPEDSDRFSNYGLDEASEIKLTAWMMINLKISTAALPRERVDATYLGLLDYNTPIFNFEKNPNNLYGNQVKKYRMLMAEEAAQLADK